METTLGGLAALVGGTLVGDGTIGITAAATMPLARPGQITFIDRAERTARLAESSASAVVAAQGVYSGPLPTIVVDDVHRAFSQIVLHFRGSRSSARTRGVSPLAKVSGTAVLAPDVDVHADAFVGEDAVIGPCTTIHTGVRIMDGCRIGANVTIFPNAVLYENTVIGDRVILHAGVVLGAYGFGYSQRDGQFVLSAQLGWVEIGSDVEIGANSTVDRGTYGPTTIGSGTKIDNLVMVGHNCQIGKHNILCSQVGIAGSTVTGDYVVMGGQVGVRDHIQIGDRANIGAKSGVGNDIPADSSMLGYPAVPLREAVLQMSAVARLPAMRKEFKEMCKEVERISGRSFRNSSQDRAA
jgi:UDP-3-O-[3-hydroxymyristoyl] glucosamine N-acyltransferase